RWSSPWLFGYPWWRMRRMMTVARRDAPVKPNIIFIVANHFEPAWNGSRQQLSIRDQISRVEQWCGMARRIGRLITDFDDVPFKHTNFYPAEQYDYDLLDILADLQAEGLGEVEIHLHHGVGAPDTAENLKRTLVEFRDQLAEEHKCLSRLMAVPAPKYGFVHGNFALGNSAGGRYCGVDSEFQILAETGCYADFTLPSAPDQSQVTRINSIYECGGRLDRARPHNTGPNVSTTRPPSLPILITGPLLLDWTRRKFGLPLPRIDNGALARNYPFDARRFQKWGNAGISVEGRPEWIFVKLYCHGFFPQDQDYCIGEPLIRSLDELLNSAHRSGEFTVHFATAREAFNMAMAAAHGKSGEPGQYRDYLLSQIMQPYVEQRLAFDAVEPREAVG
ncbi:MAG: hypothetical protein ACREAC_23510, partial [Blastocatellia bacterium]